MVRKAWDKYFKPMITFSRVSFKIDEEIRTFQAQTKVVYDH